MRVLTVRQPWAWAIVHGGKDVENRTRNIAGAYRGPVAIHAGLGWSEQGAEDWEVRRAIESESLGWPAGDGEVWTSDVAEATDARFLAGAIDGIVDLSAVHHCSDHGKNEADRCSPWAMVDHWHLCLSNARPLARPVFTKGRLGLWRPDEALEAAIRKQVIV